MVTIADLKPVEAARQVMLRALTKHQLVGIDLLYACNNGVFPRGEARDNIYANLSALIQMGLIDRVTNHPKNETWYWLTEAGWNRLGYHAPEYSGNPVCEECAGRGQEPTFDDDDLPAPCEWCDGTGAIPSFGFELRPLEDFDE